MPYFKNKDINLLFIHIPKTGCTSIELYFLNKYNIVLNEKSLFMNKHKFANKIKVNSTFQHMTWRTIYKYKKYFKINFNNLQILTIVRNPYERIISDLFYYNIINIKSKKREVYNIIQNYINLTKLDNHNIPQYIFITDKNKNLIPNVKILHTETLTMDMHQLGYTDFNLHITSNDKQINYYNYLNNDSIKLINEYYDTDFTLFGYEKL